MNVTALTSRQRLQPSRWTRPLQILTSVCAVIFTIGTTLQAFAVVNLSMMERMMRLAGQTPAEAADNAPGFLLGFRIVGCLYIIGNAIGIFAFRGHSWIFWVALVVNVTQAAGVVMIPPEFWDAALDEYGFIGILPSAITDGGALLLALVLLASLIKYRTTWARHRVG